MKKILSIGAGLLLSIVIHSAGVRAGDHDTTDGDTVPCGSLTDAEKETLLKNGNAILKACPGQDASELWGRVWVYGISKATPEEFAAIYSDYESHRTFMQGVQRSEIAQLACATTAKVYFEINVPAVRDEKQFMWHRLSQSGTDYRFEFQLAGASTFMRGISGDLSLSPLGDGTLVTHRDVILPGRMALRFGNANTANQNLYQTVQGLIRHVDSVHSSVPSLIDGMRQKLSQPACAIPQRR